MNMTVEQFNQQPEYTRHQVSMGSHRLCAYSLGDGDNVILLIHGGPGCPSNYLQDSHAYFSEKGYRIVTWDQLGCGESDKPTDTALWQLPRFVEEVETVRTALGLGKVHLVGHSWGGVVGLEYCLTHQQQLKSFVMANTTASIRLMNEGFQRLRAALGSETTTMMSRREAEGSTEHPEYQAVVTLLLYRHLCRTEEWTDALIYSGTNIFKPHWETIFGAQAFKCNGNLQGWERSNDLHKINVPVLVIQGEHDEIVPECGAQATQRLPNAEFKLFRDCSHMPFYENPDLYQQTLTNFFSKLDK